nr:UBN2 domain-containing protein [Tanacetum cinerariifolium]
MCMRISIGVEDCVVFPLSLTQEWRLDVHVVTPLPFLSKTGVPWVLIDPGKIFQFYIGMEGAESLMSDLVISSAV